MRLARWNRTLVLSTTLLVLLPSFLSLANGLLSTKIPTWGPTRTGTSTRTCATQAPSTIVTALDLDRGDSISDNEESSVSDAEALLACWSFLNKRKRLGNWTQLERRKRMRASAPLHYFWEEPVEEIYIAEHDYGDDEDPDESSFDQEEDRPDRNNNKDEVWYGEFTSFPLKPSITRVRRSQAAKKTWSDPAFRERWHQRRWGTKSQETQKTSTKKMTADEKLLENRVRSLPSDFMGSPQLASLTEDDIENAIQTYVKAKKKGVVSRAKTLKERKSLLVTTPKPEERLPRDSLFQKDQEALQEAKRQRSERAKAAYATRLKNEKMKRKAPARKSRKTFLPARATPQDALLRIEDDLDRGAFPPVDDVKVIMKPLKLAKRKDLLRKILSDLFDLRGKCVPPDLDDPDCEKEFATQSSINDLGSFVIHLLETRNSEGNSTDS
jgi:hypothetical protein